MIQDLNSGIILTIVGMGIVFLFLTLVYLIMLGIRKFIREKNITVKIEPSKISSENIDELEKTAVLCGIIKYLENNQPSLANKNNSLIDNINQITWQGK